MHVVHIYFATSDWDIIHRIQERFQLPKGVTVNGVTCQPCEIKDEDWELLKETERRGYIKIRKK
jgi:hypothetical protein